MSVEIDWQRLLEDSGEISNSIRDWLDAQFKSLELPPYIKDLSVISFDLGDIAPEITIKHIGDPFYEFYEETDDYDYSDTETAVDDNPSSEFPDGFIISPNTAPGAIAPNGEIQSRRASRAFSSGEATNERNHIDGYLHYFQPHLRSSLLTNMRSPVYSPFPHRTSTPLGSPGATNGTATPSQERNVSSSQTPEPHTSSDRRRSADDIQFFLEISYSGNMKMGVVATLLLNYPSPNFISLPLKLNVTGLEVRVLAVLAVISNKVHFSIISDNEKAMGEDGNADVIPSDTLDIIKNVRIGSEIGDEVNGSVLRNVGKVEKFLLERIRSIIRDELAWPGWITIEL